MRAPVRLLRLAGLPVLEMLQLEEALLRATSENWFLINDGAAAPAIVIGISGKVPELVDVQQAVRQRLPVIKRFSGGGTVVVDTDTVFTSLILAEGAVPGLEAFPGPIMRWTEAFYAGVFAPHGEFRLAEHDYVYGARKFGGNAQAITSRRWLHHTSLLWDFDPARMAALTQPPKQPAYRQGRDHGAFVTSLRRHLPSRAGLLEDLVANATAHFELQEASHNEAAAALRCDYLRGNKLIDLAPYQQPAPCDGDER